MRYFLWLIVFSMPLQAQRLGAGNAFTVDKIVLGTPSARQDPWLAKDKAQHFFGSFFITGLNLQLLQRAGVRQKASRQIAAGLSFSIGLGKEIRDGRQKNNIFSIPDLIADVAGIGLALLLVR
ncbi:MAG TPA: DUF2279 domain-containing protein [Caldithrix abyssi]|uniref:DUF2279 domain-containing protein n=1 Tax=Caldithrix abyssi TaxID=187145 RepID=A0A7V1LJM3_CALAY|nr:DUF2279 domain-containing protein [Caldithrix abyssi]